MNTQATWLGVLSCNKTSNSNEDDYVFLCRTGQFISPSPIPTPRPPSDLISPRPGGTTQLEPETFRRFFANTLAQESMNNPAPGLLGYELMKSSHVINQHPEHPLVHVFKAKLHPTCFGRQNINKICILQISLARDFHVNLRLIHLQDFSKGPIYSQTPVCFRDFTLSHLFKWC